MRNLTPVILQAGLKEALTEGGIVEAHSVEDAKKVGNTWTGNWRIYLRIGDQTALLVIAREFPANGKKRRQIGLQVFIEVCMRVHSSHRVATPEVAVT